MKSCALFLTLSVAAGGWASAQTANPLPATSLFPDSPFQHSAPTPQVPQLGDSVSPEALAGAAAGQTVGSVGSQTVSGATAGNELIGGEVASGEVAGREMVGGEVLAQARSNSRFGNPRTSSQGEYTKVVFDLPPSARYSISPSYTGLSVRVQGASVVAATRGALGPAVSSYRAGGSQVTLTTPHPLSAVGGWKASEATIASGGRVLILEFGQSVAGGVMGGGLESMIGGQAMALAVPTSPMASAAGSAALSRGSNYALPSSVSTSGAGGCDCPDCCSARALGAPLPHANSLGVSMSAVGPIHASSAPGDDVAPQVVAPPPLLAGAESSGADRMSGRVPGQSSHNIIAEPRIGKSPGMTRVVIDLPAGASYQLRPGHGGMQVYLSGVRAANQSDSGVSSELKGWSYRSNGSNVTLTLDTAAPLSENSGWRSYFLPPEGHNGRYRLAIDVAPALANLQPMSSSERMLPYMSGVRTASGALAYASNVRPTVVLDPGHGGRDSGAVGAVIEEQVVLDVARKTRAFLQAAGVNVIMTRDSDTQLHSDKSTDLRMRANMGARGTNFVSIHANALPASTAIRGYGVETWYNNNHQLSGAFAAILQKSMIDTSGAFSRGVKNHQSLGVLRTNRVPAALVEIGFVSHPVDGINLSDQNYLDRVALGIAKGLHQSLRTGVNAAGSEVVGQAESGAAE